MVVTNTQSLLSGYEIAHCRVYGYVAAWSIFYSKLRNLRDEFQCTLWYTPGESDIVWSIR